MKQYVTYLRVSTQRQGAQGLGISAQRNMCENFIKQNKGKQVQEFMDVESGTHRDRKGLWQAIDYCKKNGCSLVIAKLDRMSRDVEFTFKVINTGIDIHFTDMPVVNSMILGVFAAVAQYEREMVSDRTKKALAVKKAQGCKMGAANEIYRLNYKNKTEEEKAKVQAAKGTSKRNGHHASKDVQGFIKVVRKEFKQLKSDNPSEWNWSIVNCKRPHLNNMLERMQEYQMFDSSLFERWDFNAPNVEQKFRSYMQAFKKSYYSVC